MGREGPGAHADMLLPLVLLLLTASASSVHIAHCLGITSDAFYIATACFSAPAFAAAVMVAATTPFRFLQPDAWAQQHSLGLPFCGVSRWSRLVENKVAPPCRACWTAAVRMRGSLQGYLQAEKTDIRQQRQQTPQQKKQNEQRQENERQVLQEQQQRCRQREQQLLLHHKRQQGVMQQQTLQRHYSLQWTSEECRHQWEMTWSRQVRVQCRLPAEVSTPYTEKNSRVVFAAPTVCFAFPVRRRENILVRSLPVTKLVGTHAWKAAGSAVQRAASAAPLPAWWFTSKAVSRGVTAAGAHATDAEGRDWTIHSSVSSGRRAATAAAAAAFLSSGWTMPTAGPAWASRISHATRVAWHGGPPWVSTAAGIAARATGSIVCVSAEGVAAAWSSSAAPAAGAARVTGEGPAAEGSSAGPSTCVCLPKKMLFLSEKEAATKAGPAEAVGRPQAAPVTRRSSSVRSACAQPRPVDEAAARGFCGCRTAVIAVADVAAEQLTSTVSPSSNPPRTDDFSVVPFACLWALHPEAGAQGGESDRSYRRLQMLLVCNDSAVCDILSHEQCVSRATAETAGAPASGDATAESYGVGSLLLRAHHNRRRNKLGRPYGHRRCLLRNLCTQLLKYGSITTTFAKAKECKRSMDKVLMLCKQPSLHTYRQALGYFYDKRLCRQLFLETATETRGGWLRMSGLREMVTRSDVLRFSLFCCCLGIYPQAPERFAYRPHGFCRVEKMPFCRLGDNAEMARVELVD